MRACHWLAVSVIILLPSVIFSKPLSAREITTTTFSVATGEPLLQAVLNVLNGMSTGCFFFFFLYIWKYISCINPSVAPGWAIQHLINVLKWWSGLETKSLEMKRNKWAYRTSVVLSLPLISAWGYHNIVRSPSKLPMAQWHCGWCRFQVPCPRKKNAWKKKKISLALQQLSVINLTILQCSAKTNWVLF